MGDIEIPSILTELTRYPLLGVKTKVLYDPASTEIEPDGEIEPPLPAPAVMVYFLRLKAAEILALAFITTMHLSPLVPEYPPDQPAKVEFESGTAVRVTVVPALNVGPAGLAVTAPRPAPLMVMVSV